MLLDEFKRRYERPPTRSPSYAHELASDRLPDPKRKRCADTRRGATYRGHEPGLRGETDPDRTNRQSHDYVGRSGWPYGNDPVNRYSGRQRSERNVSSAGRRPARRWKVKRDRRRGGANPSRDASAG